MKKALLFSGALLALTSSMALAGGVNFGWNDCRSNTNSTGNKNFACLTNAGTNASAGSFVLSAPMNDFVAVEIVVDLQAQAASLPAWWDFSPSPSQCRGSALSITFDFSVFANPDLACTDPFNAVAQGGLANYTVSGNRARVIGVGAVASEGAQVLAAATEYYGFRLAVNNTKTVGAGSCAGCNVPVALVLNSLKAVGLAAGSAEDNSAPVISNCITWQNAGGATCAATPTANKTWGQVKSLYR
jgi:hypothetical protein